VGPRGIGASTGVCSTPLVNGAQVGEDGEDPAVVVAAFGEVELEENVVYVGLHGAFADDEPLRDTGVGEPLRHELQYPPFTLGQPVQGTTRCRGSARRLRQSSAS
jgi:hypothetical protein